MGVTSPLKRMEERLGKEQTCESPQQMSRVDNAGMFNWVG